MRQNFKAFSHATKMLSVARLLASLSCLGLAAADIQVGAVRWDAWYGAPSDPNSGIVGRTVTNDLAPKEWRYRRKCPVTTPLRWIVLHVGLGLALRVYCHRQNNRLTVVTRSRGEDEKSSVDSTAEQSERGAKT